MSVISNRSSDLSQVVDISEVLDTISEVNFAVKLNKVMLQNKY